MLLKSIRSIGLTCCATLALTACQMNGVGTNTGGSTPAGGGTAPIGVPVALKTSGQDSCGAVDYKFLQGQPFAHTFDLRLPTNSRILGRRQQKDVVDKNRLTIVASTSSAGMAQYTPSAKITKVYCG